MKINDIDKIKDIKELLKCLICEKKFIKLDEHTYKYGCKCVKDSIRVYVG